jgi:hypothetical protein
MKRLKMKHKENSIIDEKEEKTLKPIGEWTLVDA